MLERAGLEAGAREEARWDGLSSGKWEIDKSTGTPILVYDKCSVIESEQAYYLLGLIQRADTTTDERAVEALTRNIEKTADQLAASLGFLVRDWFTGPNPLKGDRLEHVIKLRIHRLLTEAALAQGESRNG
jgi:hypothetical protein